MQAQIAQHLPHLLQPKLSYQMQIQTLIFVLFSLTWILGFLALTDPAWPRVHEGHSVIVASCYCLSATLLGLVVFAFGVWRRREIRAWLCQSVRCKDKRNVYNLERPQPTLVTAGPSTHSLASIYTV